MRSNGWERWPGVVAAELVVERVDGVETRAWRTRRRTVAESLLASAQRFPDKEAVRDPEGALTYRELVESARSLAGRLQRDAGLEPGDRVALLLSNGVRFVIALAAAQLAGAVAVPLNTKLRADELTFELQDSGPRVLLADPEWWEILAPRADELRIPFVQIGIEPLLAGGAELTCVDRGDHDPALLCYTSGTTGTPKGAVSTHFNCVNNFRSFALASELDEHDRTLVCVPLFHITGLMAQLLLLLDTGGSCVILPRYDALRALEAIERERITHIVASPTVYITMLAHPERARFDVRSLRVLVSGGAPVSPDTVQALREWAPHARFQNAYGLTETTSIATATPLADALRKVRTVGLPVPVTACRTVDPATGRGCAVGEPGELLITGPQVVRGYWGRPDESAHAIRGGWLHTGDVAAIDDEGFVELLDRLKDMINRGGEKVFCVEVEAVLHDHPQVLEAAVVGVPDPVYGEAVRAVVAPRAGEEIEVEELRAFVARRLAKFKVPRDVQLVEALPRNPAGKVVKSELRD